MIDAEQVDGPEQRANPRRWGRRLWDRVPKWAKIGLVAILIGLVINVALVIRIWYGLQDPPEVAAIRAPGRHIIIPATNRDFRGVGAWRDALSIGLRGTSAKDVTAVRLDEQGTDELVAHIAKHFQNVQMLELSRGKITTDGLLVLKNCPEIFSLAVSDMDVDDGLGELLPHLPKLTTLIAMNTNLGDEFAKAAANHDRLEYSAIDGTNITPAAVEAWKKARPKTRIQTDFDRVALRSVIKWSDGETSRRFSGPFEMGRWGPRDAGGWSRGTMFSSTGLGPDQLRLSSLELKNEPDGEYQIRLKLAGVEAGPADFVWKNGVPIPHRIELRMPVTRAEAERLAGAVTKK